MRSPHVHDGSTGSGPTPPTAAAVLLYDGTCGFCAGSVQFVLRHERPRGGRTLRFATLEGALGDGARQAHPELVGVDSVIWLEPGTGRVLVRSEAALAVAAYLGGPWRLLAALGRLVPRRLRDAAYDLIARNRYRIAGRVDACPVPTPEQRGRFIDGAAPVAFSRQAG
jgi:predicted DCC family thiol-disulfide oxidoreductase YuxK